MATRFHILIDSTVFLHVTHKRRCSCLSEAHNHGDKHRDTSRVYWGRSENRVGHFLFLVQNIHLRLMMGRSQSQREVETGVAEMLTQKKKSHLWLGSEQRSPRFGGALGCCRLTGIWGLDCCLETRWADGLDDSHHLSSHCHKTSRAIFHYEEPEKHTKKSVGKICAAKWFFDPLWVKFKDVLN